MILAIPSIVKAQPPNLVEKIYNSDGSSELLLFQLSVILKKVLGLINK